MPTTLETKVRLYWGADGSGPVTNIVSATAATNIFKVAGDKRGNFLDGTPFTVAGTASNDHGYYVDGDATYDGTNTSIHVLSSYFAIVADQGAAGTITEVNNYLHFSFGVRCVPAWSEGGYIATDRLGREVRIRQVSDDDRKANRVIVQPHSSDALKLSNGNKTLAQLVYELAIQADTLFDIFHEESHYEGGSQRTTKRCYRGRLHDLGAIELLGTLSHEGNTPVNAPLQFICIDDGTFTTFTDHANITWRWGTVTGLS